MDIKLSRHLARNGPANEFDVRQVKKALNRLGYYQPYAETGITGIPDAALFVALRSFQKDRNLRATGTVNPGDETVKALNKALSNKPEGQYIWRTTGDESVRESHAQLNNSIRDWSADPDPGEEFNCRCWAETISKSLQNRCAEKEKAWVNSGAKLFIAQKNLERDEKEKSQLEKHKLQKQSELAEIDIRIEKEKNDKRDAQNIGAGLGATAGAIIGAPAGLGSSLGLAGVGIGAGDKIGILVEEVGDAISSDSETSLSLGIKKQRLIKEIKDIQKIIDSIINKINKQMLPELKKAQEEEKKAKAALEACHHKQKE